MPLIGVRSQRVLLQVRRGVLNPRVVLGMRRYLQIYVLSFTKTEDSGSRYHYLCMQGMYLVRKGRREAKKNDTRTRRTYVHGVL